MSAKGQLRPVTAFGRTKRVFVLTSHPAAIVILDGAIDGVAHRLVHGHGYCKDVCSCLSRLEHLRALEART
jgi:hypothetical protein